MESSLFTIARIRDLWNRVLLPWLADKDVRALAGTCCCLRHAMDEYHAGRARYGTDRVLQAAQTRHVDAMRFYLRYATRLVTRKDMLQALRTISTLWPLAAIDAVYRYISPDQRTTLLRYAKRYSRGPLVVRLLAKKGCTLSLTDLKTALRCRAFNQRVRDALIAMRSRPLRMLQVLQHAWAVRNVPAARFILERDLVDWDRVDQRDVLMTLQVLLTFTRLVLPREFRLYPLGSPGLAQETCTRLRLVAELLLAIIAQVRSQLPAPIHMRLLRWVSYVINLPDVATATYELGLVERIASLPAARMTKKRLRDLFRNWQFAMTGLSAKVSHVGYLYPFLTVVEPTGKQDGGAAFLRHYCAHAGISEIVIMYLFEKAPNAQKMKVLCTGLPDQLGPRWRRYVKLLLRTTYRAFRYPYSEMRGLPTFSIFKYLVMERSVNISQEYVSWLATQPFGHRYIAWLRKVQAGCINVGWLAL